MPAGRWTHLPVPKLWSTPLGWNYGSAPWEGDRLTNEKQCNMPNNPNPDDTESECLLWVIWAEQWHPLPPLPTFSQNKWWLNLVRRNHWLETLDKLFIVSPHWWTGRVRWGFEAPPRNEENAEGQYSLISHCSPSSPGGQIHFPG